MERYPDLVVADLRLADGDDGVQWCIACATSSAS
jgi:hypothetical protein